MMGIDPGGGQVRHGNDPAPCRLAGCTWGGRPSGPGTAGIAPCPGSLNPGGRTGNRTGSTGPTSPTPRNDHHAADLIEVAYRLAHTGRRVEVACDGGTGRTGTVIACMAIPAGHPAEHAFGGALRPVGNRPPPSGSRRTGRAR